MTKSPDAFRTISEVADDLDLPQHVLRFWETRFSQIKPLKRGGGRRYYRPDDVQLLRGIKHLLYGEGYTIKGVQRILREQGLRHVMGLWRDEVSEPDASEKSSRSHEAYAPKADRPRGLEPVFSEESGPAAYARSVTARRPNFEPIVDDEAEEDEDAEEEEEEEVEDAEAEDEEAEDGEEEDEDEEGEEDEEEDEETEDSDEDEEDDESEDDEEEDEEEAEEEPAGLSAEDRKKLEQTLRELTELRHVLDGSA